MIHTMILPGSLNTHNIPYTFHYADSSVIAARIGTDGAFFPIGNHGTHPAVLHFFRQPVNGPGKMMNILLGLLQKMQRQTQGAAGANPRKGTDGFHSVF